MRHRTVQVNGIETFYRETGPEDAPVLVLPHGYPGSSFVYRHLMASLGDRWRLIAPDLPGFGYSAIPARTPAAASPPTSPSRGSGTSSPVSCLIVWGPHDGYMPEAAARAYHRDLPEAELHLLDGGHWLLETHLAQVVPLVRDFLHRVHPPTS